MGRPTTELKWCIGTQALGPGYLEDRRARDEHLQLRVIGRLRLDGVTADQADQVILAQWVLGRTRCSPEVRQVLATRRRWRRTGPVRIDRSKHCWHRVGRDEGVFYDLGVGLSYFDVWQLEDRLAVGERLEIVTFGVLAFGPEVSPELANAVVRGIRLKGRLRATPDVRAVLAEKSRKSD